MRKILILVLFIFNLSYSQTSEIDRLMLFGDRAAEGNDFASAKKLYNRIIFLDSLNKDALYKLGVAELNLKQTDSACEHMYKSFQLKNQIVAEHIKLYCQDFPQFMVYDLKEVDQKPKFIFKGEAYDLFGENDLSKKYKEIIIKEIRNSDLLYKQVRGRGNAYITFHINKEGKFDGKVIRIVASDQRFNKAVEKEIIDVFQKINYIPANHKGRTVEISNIYSLPIDFGH